MNPHPTRSLWRGLTALAVAALGASIYAADTEKDLEKTFTVTPGGRLTIEADRGSIAVVPGQNDRVTVHVFRKVTGANADKAEEILAKHEVTFSQEGNQVKVRAKSPTKLRNWGWKSPNLQVRYEVTAPAQFSTDLKTAGGSITVGDFAGESRSETAGGRIRVGAIDGKVKAHTAGGSIHVTKATQTVEARTAGGSIEIGEAAEVDAETAGGSIELGKVRGRLRARTAGGGIQIREASGPVDAQTAGGSITAVLSGTPEEDCRLETSAGSIELRLPRSISANVDARTSAGSVKTDLPVVVQGEQKQASLQGKLGDGGRMLTLRTSGGNIRIAPQ